MEPKYYIYSFVILLTIYGIAVGNYPKFKMNRATIALIGAVVLILINAISFERALLAVDLNTILLLFSMMVINSNLKIAGFFNKTTQFVLEYASTPIRLLFLVTFSSGILSALFLNDTIVLAVTPVLIDVLKRLKRNPVPYIIALVASANIGSSATLIGNPQNMIIGIASGINFVDYTLIQSIPSIIGLFLINLVIIPLYRKEFNNENFGAIHIERVYIYKPLLVKSIVSLIIMLAMMVIGINLALSAFTAAAILLFTRRLKPERVFQEIDWSLLVFFSGLFIITDSIETSGIGKMLFVGMKPFFDDGLASFTVTTAFLSNLVSNVPAVILIKPLIPLMGDQDKMWMVLGFASTFAGNLTLLGSVANLIGVEIARKQNIIISFREYLKSGILITVLSIAVGLIWFIYIT